MQAVKSGPVRLSDLVREGDVHLALAGSTKAEVLHELVDSLRLDPDDADCLLRVLQRREGMGSTGVGHGVAVPHCRTVITHQLRVVFGRHREGVEWGSPDGEPVRLIFLLVAPPAEASNLYLPTLGKVAQFANDSEIRRRLGEIRTAAQFVALVNEVGL